MSMEKERIRGEIEEEMQEAREVRAYIRSSIERDGDDDVGIPHERQDDAFENAQKLQQRKHTFSFGENSQNIASRVNTFSSQEESGYEAVSRHGPMD